MIRTLSMIHGICVSNALLYYGKANKCQTLSVLFCCSLSEIKPDQTLKVKKQPMAAIFGNKRHNDNGKQFN